MLYNDNERIFMNIKKITIIFLLSVLLIPSLGYAQSQIDRPGNATAIRSGDTASLFWKNPATTAFSSTILFRSAIFIDDFFTYEAVEGICDKLYDGKKESYFDTELAVNLPYYYILFTRDKLGSISKALVLEAKEDDKAASQEKKATTTVNSLAGASSDIVAKVSFNEAGLVYNYNKPENTEFLENTKRLSLFIIARSPQALSQTDKNSISYFIEDGTPTTIVLGSGERAGVLNSYLSVYDKLPKNILEWQDIIKIANGRWPDERSLSSEEKASDVFFSAIYERKPDMNNPNDNAAVTVIAYGLRPADRNLDSEKKAIEIYRAIFDKSPTEATDWDLVRAIAYSGATR